MVMIQIARLLSLRKFYFLQWPPYFSLKGKPSIRILYCLNYATSTPIFRPFLFVGDSKQPEIKENQNLVFWVHWLIFIASQTELKPYEFISFGAVYKHIFCLSVGAYISHIREDFGLKFECSRCTFVCVYTTNTKYIICI